MTEKEREDYLLKTATIALEKIMSNPNYRSSTVPEIVKTAVKIANLLLEEIEKK